MNDAAKTATLSTVGIVLFFSLVVGGIIAAQFYQWVGMVLVAAFVVFCVWALWMNLYNAEKRRQNTSEWDEAGYR